MKIRNERNCLSARIRSRLSPERGSDILAAIDLTIPHSVVSPVASYGNNNTPSPFKTTVMATHLHFFIFQIHLFYFMSIRVWSTCMYIHHT